MGWNVTVPTNEPKKKDYRIQIIAAIIGAVAAVIAALIPVFLPDEPEVKVTASPAAQSVSLAPSASDSPEPETTEPVEDPTTGDSVTVPEEYQGTWSGTVEWLIPGWASYDVEMSLTSGGLTETVGQFSLNDGQCRGLAHLESGGGPVVVRLTTTYNGTGTCSTRAEVRLTLDGDEMEYALIGAEFATGYVSQPSPSARGMLQRQ